MTAIQAAKFWSAVDFSVLRVEIDRLKWKMRACFFCTQRNVDVESRVKDRNCSLSAEMKHSRLFNGRVEVTDLVSDAVPEIAEVERRKRQAQENQNEKPEN